VAKRLAGHNHPGLTWRQTEMATEKKPKQKNKSKTHMEKTLGA